MPKIIHIIKPKFTRSATSRRREYLYMVTVRKSQVKDFVTVGHLDFILESVVKPPKTITNIVYEIENTYNQLHLHCIVSSPYRVCYAKNNKFGGYIIHWKPVFSLDGCISYIQKQSANMYEQSQTIEVNWYNHHFGFI